MGYKNNVIMKKTVYILVLYHEVLCMKPCALRICVLVMKGPANMQKECYYHCR